MHIVIAGAARSGKTTLAKKIRELGFIHYKMDSIKRGMCKVNNIKTVGWTDYSKEVVTVIKQVIEDEKEDNIIFDTPHISPLDAKELEKDAVVIFLGYDTMSTNTFLSLTKKYDKNTWSSNLPKEELIELFLDCKKFSIENKKLCKKLGIKYFDVSKDRNKVLNEAYLYITDKLKISNVI